MGASFVGSIDAGFGGIALNRTGAFSGLKTLTVNFMTQAPRSSPKVLLKILPTREMLAALATIQGRHHK